MIGEGVFALTMHCIAMQWVAKEGMAASYVKVSTERKVLTVNPPSVQIASLAYSQTYQLELCSILCKEGRVSQ